MTQDAHTITHSPAPHLIPPLPAYLQKKHIRTRPRKKTVAVHSWFEGPYNSVRGENALWVAVITQAMMDALNRSRHPESLYHKHAAIEWLTGGGKDFAMVCSFAGLDPNYVRRMAKKAIASPTLWRAAPGKGERYLERKAYRQRMREPHKEEERGTATILHGPWQQRSAYDLFQRA